MISNLYAALIAAGTLVIGASFAISTASFTHSRSVFPASRQALYFSLIS